MKKIVALLSISILTVPFSSAQNRASVEKEKLNNRFIVNGGTSFGYFRSLPGWNKTDLPIEGSLEYGVSDYVSLGISFAHQNRGFFFLDKNHPGGDAVYKYTNTYNTVCLRTSIYFTDFIINTLGVPLNENKVDFYLTYIAGVTFRKYSPHFDEGNVNYSNFRMDEDLQFLIGTTTGVRYYLTENIGLYTEVGPAERGFIKAGLTLKL